MARCVRELFQKSHLPQLGLHFHHSWAEPELKTLRWHSGIAAWPLHLLTALLYLPPVCV